MSDFTFLPPRPVRQADAVLFQTFDCGVQSLNGWLVRKALYNEIHGGSRTYVLSTSDGELAGFFCLAAHSVEHEDFRSKFRRNMPNPVPVILLGRLAVDKKFAGCGVGTSLLKVAVAMTRELARSIGVAALVVHPLNDRATRFYLERGFVHAKAGKDLLVFPVSDPAV